MARVSQVIVLAEDERQQRLIRSYLQQLNYTPHDVRLESLPSGRGSGEAWVRSRYAPDVKAYRARAARAQTSLVVAIDADTGDVARVSSKTALPPKDCRREPPKRELFI